MTSRALFYKGMIQDLRHRIWMIALSCLASFMAMPVFYLLQKQSWDSWIIRRTENPTIGWDLETFKLESVTEFFRDYLTITCGIVLVVGALIVGIFGFRYVFSKKMVDLYHSVPITRKQLFLIHYVNGFLIWFVPMIIGAVVCALMALAFLGDFGVWFTTLGTLLVTIVNLVLAFLIVYHLAILAVMISGNILNTLINGTIMGLVVIALYGMMEIFASTYFDTYYSFFNVNFENIIWASPLAGAISQLVMRCGEWCAVPVIMNIVMIVLMFAAGFIFYIRRPSELAEQGMKTKWLQVVFKTAMTILAGMVGWIFFGLLTSTTSIGWMIFGTVLASVLVYGIMDIIFHMDFKAFFKHKLQMVLTTIAGILIGFVFLFDWIGFDTYVPDKDRIESMGIYIGGIGYNGSYSAYDGELYVQNRIANMSYTDADVIYPLLAEMAGRDETYPANENSGIAYVRVTEKSGKIYYRQYRIWESDEELVLPVLRDESYVKANVQMPQILIDNIVIDGSNNSRVELGNTHYQWVLDSVEQAQEILEAYNADVLESPDTFIYQEEKIFAQLNMRNYSDSNYYYMNLDLYESMDNVIAVLKKYGYDNMLESVKAEELQDITMQAWTTTEQQGNLKAFFGLEEVILDNTANGEIAESYGVETASSSVSAVEYVVVEETAQAYDGYYYSAVFDKEEDIAELLEVVSLMTADNYSIFGPDYCSCDVILNFKNGDTYYGQIKKGVLPEKFIDNFEQTEY